MLAARLKAAKVSAASVSVLRAGAVTQKNESSGGSVSVAVPSHSPGDYLYMCLTVNSISFVTSIPAGWTLLGKVTATPERLGVYYKIASSSEPASYTWGIAAAYALVSFAVGNVSSQTLGTIAVSGGIDNSVSVSAVTTYNNGLLFLMSCADNVGSVTARSATNYTMTQQAEIVGTSLAGSSAFAVNTAPANTSGNSSGTGSVTISSPTGLAAVFLAVGP